MTALADLRLLADEYIALQYPDDDVRATASDTDLQRMAYTARSKAVLIVDLLIDAGFFSTGTLR